MKIIIETDEFVKIDGEKIDGFVFENRFCKECESKLVFHEKYDTPFCPECNEWTEERCETSDCVYCSNRPEKPLSSSEEKNKL